MKKTALLIDGGWFCKGIQKTCTNAWPTAQQVVNNAKSALQTDEEIFRIFYYDCEPFNQIIKNPIDGSKTNYASTKGYANRKRFFEDLKKIELVALRRGELKARGWKFKGNFHKSLINSGATTSSAKTPTASDVYPNFEQKGVDMRIGIDVATLAIKKVVERIILFSGDTDMIPALKLARREGLQIFIVRINGWNLINDLLEDSDGVRIVTPKK